VRLGIQVLHLGCWCPAVLQDFDCGAIN
jgi:hypothetical protein